MKLRDIRVKLLTDDDSSSLEDDLQDFLTDINENEHGREATFISLDYRIIAGEYSVLIVYTE